MLPAGGPNAAIEPPPATLTVRLTPALEVTGTVLGTDGKPAAGQAVFLVSLDLQRAAQRGPVSAHALVTTAADGTFRSRVGIRGAKVQWRLGIGGTWCGGLPVTIPADAEAVRLDPIRLADGVVVTGRVLAKGSPVVDSFMIRALPVDGSPLFPLVQILSDTRGRYRLPWLPKGHVKVTAGMAGSTAEATLELSEDRELDLELR